MLKDICVSPGGADLRASTLPAPLRIPCDEYSEREASRSHTSSAFDVSTLEGGGNIFICLDFRELLRIVTTIYSWRVPIRNSMSKRNK
jgi:hypothetical protein